MTFSKQIPATIKTTNTKIPPIPDFSFENPLKKNMFVNGIEIVSTPEFSRKGVIIIAVDNNILFDSRDTEGFSNVAFMPVNLNAVFERDRFVTVSAFNQVDKNEIKVTINVFVDEVERTLDSSLQYISDDVVNSVVSELETIFPQIPRTNIEETQIIQMKGYHKLILMIDVALYDSPTAIIGGSNVVDGDLNTFGDTSNVNGAGNQFAIFGKVDFGNIASRLAKVKFKQDLGLGTYRYDFERSDDDSIWTLIATVTNNTTANQFLDSGVDVSFRYLRISATFVSGSIASTNVGSFELYDSNIIGGTAEVSFEVENAFGAFLTLIDAASIGSIVQGTNVVKTIGDVINDLGNDKFNYSLPSNQTRFRIRLKILNGSITVGVSVEFVQ